MDPKCKGPSTSVMRTLTSIQGITDLVCARYSLLFEDLNPLGKVLFAVFGLPRRVDTETERMDSLKCRVLGAERMSTQERAGACLLQA